MTRKLSLLILCLSLGLLSGRQTYARGQSENESQQDVTQRSAMSKFEKLDSWKGEKVILPMDAHTRANEKLYFGGNRSGYGDYLWHQPGNPKEGVPRTVQGRTGVIVEVEKDLENWWNSNVTIELDGSGERIVLSSVAGDYLTFQAEIAAAQALVGQTWWSRGTNYLKVPGDTVRVNNLEPLVLSRVERDDADGTVSWYFKSDRVGEGKLDRTVYVESRFHPNDDTGDTLYTRRFHVKDLHEQFPKWSKATWELIEKSIIAIGMTKEMAELACGDQLAEVGAVLSPSGAAAPIYSCRDKKFLVEGGKVTKYAD